MTRERLVEQETRAAATAARRRHTARMLTRLLVLATLFAAWQAIASRYSSGLLPGPVEVYGGLVRGWRIIVDGAIATATEVAIGFAMAGTAGVVLGAVLGESRIVQRICHPYLVVYQALPKTGFAPMIVLLLGVGMMPKIALAAVSAIFPVVENTIIGIQRVDDDSLRLFRALGANRWQSFVKLRLVNALPSILTGLRAAVVLAVVSVVVAEFVAGRIGLGAVMMVGAAQLDAPLVFAALFVLTLVGLAYYFVARLLELIVLHWFNLAHPSV